jgi:hypothetical protein
LPSSLMGSGQFLHGHVGILSLVPHPPLDDLVFYPPAPSTILFL